ncbi:negative cofactor 2 transcription regulator complex subunit ncb2 [Balamuthia mandrillaris]
MSSSAEDVTLPKATVSKIIKEMLPPGIKCANETRDLILECCVEFIHLISSEANEICSKENKKTIAPQHILDALQMLGFEEYLEEVRSVSKEVENMEKPKKIRKSLESSGLSQEELLREQQELFARARSALNSSREAENRQKQQTNS